MTLFPAPHRPPPQKKKKINQRSFQVLDLLLKTSNRSWNGVTYAKPHTTKRRLGCSLALPELELGTCQWGMIPLRDPGIPQGRRLCRNSPLFANKNSLLPGPLSLCKCLIMCSSSEPLPSCCGMLPNSKGFLLGKTPRNLDGPQCSFGHFLIILFVAIYFRKADIR